MAFTIACDLDGVVVGFEPGWVAEYERWFGVKIDKRKLGSWDSWKAVTHFETEAEFWAWTDKVPGFWENLPAVPGALGALYTWQAKYGHEVTFVTNRHSNTRAATLEWVRRNYPVAHTLPRIEHVPLDGKGLVDCQVYIDDNPRVLESLSDRPCVIIFDQPWNREVSSTAHLHRVKGWDAVTKFLHYLEHPEESLTEGQEVLVPAT